MSCSHFKEEEFDVAADNGTRGEDEGDEESREAETEEEASSGGTNPEESACGVSSGSQIASEQTQSGEGPRVSKPLQKLDGHEFTQI